MFLTFGPTKWLSSHHWQVMAFRHQQAGSRYLNELVCWFISYCGYIMMFTIMVSVSVDTASRILYQNLGQARFDSSYVHNGCEYVYKQPLVQFVDNIQIQATSSVFLIS